MVQYFMLQLLRAPTGVLSPFNSKWSEEHCEAAKHLLQYIKGSIGLCFTFDASNFEQSALRYAECRYRMVKPFLT